MRGFVHDRCGQVVWISVKYADIYEDRSQNFITERPSSRCESYRLYVAPYAPESTVVKGPHTLESGLASLEEGLAIGISVRARNEESEDLPALPNVQDNVIQQKRDGPEP